MKNKIKSMSVLAFLSVMLLTGCRTENPAAAAEKPEPGRLVVYTSHKEEIYGPIVREFEERTGIWVEVIEGGTNEILDKISSEAEEPVADIMFGGGVDSLSAYEDCFESYRSNRAELLSDTYASPGDRYTVFSRLPVVICCNSRLVHSAGKPRSWSDLTDGYWKGKLAFADPAKSGSSYTGLYTFCQLTRDEAGSFDNSVRLFRNNLEGDILSGSGEVMDRIISGEKVIGIVLEESALKEMAKNADIEMIYPREGITAVPDGSAIIRGCPNPENARLFIEFTVCDDVQRLLEDRMFRRSVRTDFGGSDIREVVYDIQDSRKNREKLISYFNRDGV